VAFPGVEIELPDATKCFTYTSTMNASSMLTGVAAAKVTSALAAETVTALAWAALRATVATLGKAK
jgi:hypothetical protein